MSYNKIFKQGFSNINMKKSKAVDIKQFVFLLILFLVMISTFATISSAVIDSSSGTQNPTTVTSTNSFSDSMKNLWGSIKEKTGEAVDWTKTKAFGEEIPSIFDLKWWEQEQWNNPAWWSSTFCAADTRTSPGIISGSWNWLMILVGARSTDCYDFWIKQGLLAFFSAFWAVIFAKIYVDNFGARTTRGNLKKEEIPSMLMFLSGRNLTGTMEAQAGVRGWLKTVLYIVLILAIIFLGTGLSTTNQLIIPISIATITIIAGLTLPKIRKEWFIPIALTTIIIWVIMKIVIVKLILWPLVIISSDVIAPVATGLWIVWYPIWSVIKERRRLRELEAAANSIGLKYRLLAKAAEGTAEGVGKGVGKSLVS